MLLRKDIEPPTFIMINNKSALDNKEFVDSAVADLLQEQCISEVPFKPHNVNPFSVATNSSGKKRLILDLSILNSYVKKAIVKLEDYKTAKEYLVPKCYLYKFNFFSGYHHLPIILMILRILMVFELRATIFPIHCVGVWPGLWAIFIYQMSQKFNQVLGIVWI